MKNNVSLFARGVGGGGQGRGMQGVGMLDKRRRMIFIHS